MRRTLLAFAILAAPPAFAQTPPIEVTPPWARATAPNARVGGLFFTLTDRSTPDRLLSASTPVAATAEIHRTVNENGVMKMLPIDGIDLNPGQPVEFKPGGLHIMLIDLKEPLKQGEKFPLTLTFESGKTATVQVAIRQVGAVGPGAAPPRAGHGAHTPPAKPTK